MTSTGFKLFATVVLCSGSSLLLAGNVPQPAPAQTPAATPAAQSSCPKNPAAPLISGALAEKSTEIKGTANKPVAGCPSQIEVHATSDGDSKSDHVLDLSDKSDPQVKPDGTFLVNLKNALAAGQTITVRQVFDSGNGVAAPKLSMDSAAVTVQAVAQAGTAQSSCPKSPTTPTVSGTLWENTNEITGKANPPISGCPSQIEVHTADKSGPKTDHILELTDKSDPQVHPDGTFTVNVKNALMAGQTITVRQVFTSTNAASPAPKASMDSAAATVEAAPPMKLAAPRISGPLREGATGIAGTAALPTPAQTGCAAQVEVHGSDDGLADNLMQLTTGLKSNVNTDGTFSVTLQQPLTGGEKIRVVEVFNGCTQPGLPATLASDAIVVVVPGDWGRIRGYFTSGVLLSQDQNSFSQASIFLAFTLDKTWRMPGYYHPRSKPWERAMENQQEKALGKQIAAAQKTESAVGCDQNGGCPEINDAQSAAQLAQENKEKECLKYWHKSKCAKASTAAHEKSATLQAKEEQEYRSTCSGSNLTTDQKKACDDARVALDAAAKAVREDTKTVNKHPMSRAPGINTFFDVRLTSIAVSACNPTSSGTNTQTSTASSTTSPCAPANGNSVDTFLSQRKTARLGVGAYFPWTITSWKYNRRQNALFLAPLAKVGFDTPAGALTQVQPSSTPGSGAAVSNAGTVTAVNPTSFYNFYGYGGRIGHYALTSSRNEAPELVSYLDVIFGRFSNLETLVIPETGPQTAVTRMRLYRLNLEGVLKIPSTPLILGFSANVGQETLGLGPRTIVQRAGDDLRFLFGVKFDAAKLIAAIQKAVP